MSDGLLVEARGLRKVYGGHVALDGIDLSLATGEVVGFLGPNGAGKSTTMKILAGFILPSAGVARIGGHDLIDEPLACRRKIGYLPQDLPLYPDMRTDAYLDHVARLKHVPASQRRAEVVRVIERCDLSAVARRHIAKLSGGNRQRVGLAQALIGRPPLLILDEATAGLDPAQVANFRDLIADLAGEHSILLSTHIMAEVEACCSRVVMIHHGRNLIDESVQDLQDRTRQLARIRLRLSGDGDQLRDELAACEWVADCHQQGDALLVDLREDRREELLELVRGRGLREMTEERIPLEEVFRQLVA